MSQLVSTARDETKVKLADVARLLQRAVEQTETKAARGPRFSPPLALVL